MENNEKIHNIIEQAIENYAPFGDVLSADEKQTLTDYGAVHSAVEGEMLCRQGDKDRRVFITIMGEVEISEGTGNDKVVLAHLKRGEVFGEIAALFEPARISNVMATKPSVFLIIPGEVFEKVITGRSELYNAILERYKKRLSETAIRGVDLFRSLDVEAIAPLVKAATLVGLSENKVIIEQGEQGDYFYILIRGTARVSYSEAGKSMNIALIHPGDYFGEWSVLTGSPRAATVIANSQVDMLRIERSVILDFIQKQPSVAEKIDSVAHVRHDNLSATPIPDSDKQLTAWLKNLEDVVQKAFKT